VMKQYQAKAGSSSTVQTTQMPPFSPPGGVRPYSQSPLSSYAPSAYSAYPATNPRSSTLSSPAYGHTVPAHPIVHAQAPVPIPVSVPVRSPDGRRGTVMMYRENLPTA
jgi:hypothetical protein